MNSPLLTEELISQYFKEERVLLSKHFRDEMEAEILGEISVVELLQAASAPKILKQYPEDKPYPSLLALGFTTKGRPLHFVCARDENRDILVLITVYEPSKELWIDNRERKET